VILRILALRHRRPRFAAPGTRTRPRSAPAGFSLIELLVALASASILLAIGVPAYQSYLATQRLKGSVENLAAFARVARERAMATGVDQPLHFREDTYDADFHVHIVGSSASSLWSFPRGIHYAAGSTNTITMKKNGTAWPAGLVLLRNDRGRQDTLSVLASGIVLLR
jgi:prepilin-type N-terminal cleavage/methylation domain-containing protein